MSNHVIINTEGADDAAEASAVCAANGYDDPVAFSAVYEPWEDKLDLHSRSSTSSSADDLSDAYSVDTDTAVTFLTSLAESPRNSDVQKHSVAANEGVERFLSSNVTGGAQFQIGLPRINVSNRCYTSSICSSHKRSPFHQPHPPPAETPVQRVYSDMHPYSQGRSVAYTMPLSPLRPALDEPTQSSRRFSWLLSGFTRASNRRRSDISQDKHGRTEHWNYGSFLRRSKRSGRKHGVSYSSLLVPSCSSTHRHDGQTEMYKTLTMSYDSTLLGVSMVPVKGNKKARQEVNRQFQQAYPWLHQSMTMSKLRNLKHDIFSLIDKVPNLDPSTVAMAWTYFERLVSLQVVHKATRKQLAGACLVLAYKFNQALRSHQLCHLVHALQTLDRKDHLRPRDIFAMEFKVFATIGFNLQVSFADIGHHLQEYLTFKNRAFDDEYGVTEAEFSRDWLSPVAPAEFEVPPAAVPVSLHAKSLETGSLC